MTSEEAYDQYLAAVRAGDRREAFAVVDRACAARMDAPTLYVQVLQPALREIGRLWQENEISVADEHLATAITQAAMTRLFDRTVGDSRFDGPLLIAACAPLRTTWRSWRSGCTAESSWCGPPSRTGCRSWPGRRALASWC